MKKKNGLRAKVRAYLRAREAGRQEYKRSDELMAEIIAMMKPGEETNFDATGRKAVLKDRFEGKEIVWTPCAARRWELEVVEPSK